MAKYAQGIYEVLNPQKYIGLSKPKFRSGWEMAFFRFCDNNPAILQWASESIKIPYRNPLTGKQTIYVPDIFMVYQNKFGQKIAEVIEIKPSKQTLVEEAKSQKDKLAVVINHAKWQAANAWCKHQGIKFRVVTEKQLFHNGSK
jgi:hypothetical protein